MTNDFNNLEEYIPDASSLLIDQFRSFYQLLEKYNSKINLVSKSSAPYLSSRHFADSYRGMQICKDLLPQGEPVFDFGSGNGFPGIIAGMMLTDHQFVLVERDLRKSEFLKIAADHLGLKNIHFHSGAIAEIKDDGCRTVISRAMAPLPKFLLEARRVVPPGGNVFLYKGESWSTEMGACPPQIFDHWELDVLGDYTLPVDDAPRFIIHCKKF